MIWGSLPLPRVSGVNAKKLEIVRVQRGGARSEANQDDATPGPVVLDSSQTSIPRILQRRLLEMLKQREYWSKAKQNARLLSHAIERGAEG